MSAQPSPEAVVLVAAACRTNGVLAIAVWQGIDVTVEQANADAAEEALFQYIQRLEADRAQLATLRAAYAGGDFADEQYPGQVVLKFAFGGDLLVSADFDATIRRVAA